MASVRKSLPFTEDIPALIYFFLDDQLLSITLLAPSSLVADIESLRKRWEIKGDLSRWSRETKLMLWLTEDGFLSLGVRDGERRGRKGELKSHLQGSVAD
jgi:hypothetical protein